MQKGLNFLMGYKNRFNNNFNSNFNRKRTNDREIRTPGIFVEVRNGDITKALRKFKRKVSDSGILQEIRDRQFYKKPSEKRKEAKAAGIARRRKAERERLSRDGF